MGVLIGLLWGVVGVIILLVQMAWAFRQVRGVALPPLASLPDRGPAAFVHALTGDLAGVVVLIGLLLLVTTIGVTAIVRREGP